MSRLCGRLIANGARCLQPVADPQADDCGRHRPTVAGSDSLPRVLPLDERGCRILQETEWTWRCLVHAARDPAWEAAQAMGAVPPCQVPVTAGVRLSLARQYRLSLRPSTACLLARDPVLDVRLTLAQNYKTPPAAQEILANDPSESVRMAVASAGPPPAVLHILATDPTEAIRTIVAHNVSTPAADLVRLAADPLESVRRAACFNPFAPDSIRKELPRPDQ